MTDDIKNLITDVIGMVEDVPEDFQRSSFEVLLNYFLIQSQPSLNMRVKKRTAQKHSKTDSLQVILNSKYDWASTGIKQLKGIMQYIKILDVVQQEFGVDKLSTSEIKTILEQKFRQKKTISAISMSLMTFVGVYVDRFKEDKEYKYGITVSGQEKLIKSLEKMKDEN